MNALIPFNFESNEIRALNIHGEPWFVAADVAKLLNYQSAKDLTRGLDDFEKGRHNLPTLGGIQEATIINESGLYSAILRSRKPEAKRFKQWVTSEVLPTIRKTGTYNLKIKSPFKSKDLQDIDLANLSTQQALLMAVEVEQENVALRAANDELSDENEALNEKVEADAPKVEFADVITADSDRYSMAQAAKLLNTGRNRLMEFLREIYWLTLRGNEPYQDMIERGYLDYKFQRYTDKQGLPCRSITPLVTGKGLEKLQKLMKKSVTFGKAS